MTPRVMVGSKAYIMPTFSDACWLAAMLIDLRRWGGLSLTRRPIRPMVKERLDKKTLEAECRKLSGFS